MFTRWPARRGRRLRLWAPAITLLVVIAALAGCGGSSPHTTSAKRQPSASRPANPPPAGAARGRPNIVFVLTDDLATNLVQYMPHVQQMERDGVTFSNYFVTDSLCCPSRASIFTGRFPHNTGVYTNTPPDGGFPAFQDHGDAGQTFATLLQQQGYRTAMMGKYLNGYKPSATEGGAHPYVPPGWSEWDVAGNGYPEFDYTLNENGHLVHYGHDPQSYLTDVIAQKGLGFIDQAAAARTPFMLELATFAPHAPYVPAPRNARDFPGLQAPRGPAFNLADPNAPTWLRDYKPLTSGAIALIDRAFRLRVQSVQAVDQMLGRIEQELVARGIAKNTYIVFSSDNGLHMGEHRLLPGKLTAFDTDIKVPLVVTGPDVPAGATASQLAENIDLMPTFAEIGGVAPPANVDGQSLLPLIRGEQPADWRGGVLVEHHGRDTAPNDPDLPTRGAGNPPNYEALRTQNFLYVAYGDGEREYYDLRNDPNELSNTAALLPPDRLSALDKQVSAIANCQGSTACQAAERAAGR